MRLEALRGLKAAALLALACAAVFFLALLITSYVASPRGGNFAHADEPFDFNSVTEKGYSWAGPPAGQRVDLDALKGADGRTLATAIGERPAMIVMVDPQCAACFAALDQLREVREAAERDGIRHYLVSFNASQSPDKFFSYAASLGLGAPTYLWGGDQPPHESLVTMVVPSHLLVDPRGVILHKWPGTDPRTEVRMRMAATISRDAREAVAGAAKGAQGN